MLRTMLFLVLATVSGFSYAKWTYRSSTDEMTSKKIYFARSTSNNQVTFPFPYGGPQHAYLTLRKHPRMGNDAYLSLDSAQFLCHSDDCSLLVRFDNQPPETFDASPPSDHSRDTIFISNYDTFMRSLVKAKRIRIEAQFFQSGMRVFDFYVQNLAAQFSADPLKELQLEAQRKLEDDRHLEERRIAEARREEAPKPRVEVAAGDGKQQEFLSQHESMEAEARSEAAARAARQKVANDWRARIQAKIRSRVVVPPGLDGNPEAQYDVVLLPGGEVLSATLRKSSGNMAYDAAVERAIIAAQPLPVPTETDLFQENFRELSLSFRPKD